MCRFRIALVVALCFSGAAFAQTPALIQAVSGSNTNGASPGGSITNGGTYNLPLPNASLAGNLLICAVNLDSTGPPGMGVQDNKNNAWSLGASVTDPVHGTIVSVWYAPNVAAGTTLIQFKVTGNSVHDFGMACYEFNNIATSSPIDGVHTNFATSATISAGSFAPATDGDLIFQYAARTTGAAVTYIPGASPWVLASADRGDSGAAQYQVQATHAAINPTFATAASTPYATVAVAFKSASAGTARPAGLRVLRLTHNNTQNETASTVTLQQPTREGNTLVIAQSAGETYRMASVSDGTNTFTSVGCLVVAPDASCIFYAKNITPSAATVLTITMAGIDAGGHGASFFVYEIAGADTTAPLDTGFGVNGFASANGFQDPSRGSGPIATFTATPSSPNELVIVVGSVAADTATGWSSPMGAQQIPVTYSGELNPTNADENNPAGLLYTGASTAAQTWTFTHDLINSPGAGTWVVVGAAFKASALGPSDSSAPTAPANLSATPVSNSQINLAWTPSTDDVSVTGYVVDLCQGVGCTSFGRVAVLPGTATTHNDTGLLDSTSYSYRVSATDSTGNTSAFSNIATATTHSAAPVFTPPSGLTATVVGSTQINLSWTAATETGGTISNYLIERCQSVGCAAFAQVGTSTTTTFSNAGLLASSSYSYRVRASDAASNFSAYSNVASATTLSTAPTFTPPSNLTATVASSTQINLSWTAATETGGTISNYLIERCQSVGCTSFAQVGTSTTTTFSNAGLLAFTSYSYRVRATDAASNFSAYSNVSTATTPSTAPTFTAPSNLTATLASSTQINLSWTAATETGGTISTYLIERCRNAGCTDFAQVAASTTTSFSNTSLLASTSYSYRVRASDAASNFSPYSNVASATTSSNPPPPPTAISFIQANAAVPQTPQSAVTVRYFSAQRVGDLNVVVVGWNDSIATVSSVSDTIGNVYALAVGPTVVSGKASQSIYYAKNIAAAAANANTVTVRFNRSAIYPDIRIAEYSGIDTVNPLDVVAASSGNGANSSSGAVNTTNANDLIIGANLVLTGTPVAGSGFTKRIITSPDGDILEDRIVAVIGSYSATAPVSAPNVWIMQLVAFKALP